MSQKIELKNGRVAYCDTINPKTLNEIEARFGSKIKSVAGYNATSKAENGTKTGGYVRDMSNLDIPMYIFYVFISWDGIAHTSKPGYPSGKKYKNLRKKIELLEYNKPNQYTANFAPLNWVDNKGRRYFETYGEGSNDDYFEDMNESGYVRYYYFFPKDKFSVTEAQKLINAEHPKNYGFTLDKHPDLYAYGNKIPNHYKGMEGENVWNGWSKGQRKHFVYDHFREFLIRKGENSLDDYIKLEYKKLPGDIQMEIDDHVSMGQYKTGGRMYKGGGSTEKPNFKELAETNHYGLDEKDLETLWDEGNVEINHWTFFHVGNEWETIYDGLYMEVFSSFEDMLNRENQKAYYEYSEELSDKLGQETFADENGNIREYSEGGLVVGDFFAQELGATGTTINKAERGKKLGFAYQVGDKVMVNDRGYVKYFSGFDTSKPATILDRSKTKSGYFYEIQFADGRKPFNNAPQGLLEPYTEKAKNGTKISDFKELEEDDYVWNAVGKKLVVDKVTQDEYYLSSFGKMTSSPFSKKKVNEYIKNGEWTLKPKSSNSGEVETFGLGGDIKKYKDALIKKAKTKGIYENFGNEEVSKLQDKYKYNINASQWSDKEEWDNKRAIDQFENWAMNFDLSQFAGGGQTDLFDEEIAEMVDETPDMTETKTKYRAEVGATGENTWSTNSMEYDTEDEAKNWLKGLASRWFGYNISRVVPVTTPRGETIDVSTQNIFQNYRKHGGTTFPIWRKQKFAGGGSVKEYNSKVADKMDKIITMQSWAEKVRNMPNKVTRNDLETLLPDFVSGGDITKVLSSTEQAKKGKKVKEKDTNQIPEDDFYADYKPEKNKFDSNASWDGSMYETYGEEYDYIVNLVKDPEDKFRVWTIVEDDNGDLIVVAGWHFVNRFGYLVTEKPWNTGNEYVKDDEFRTGGQTDNNKVTIEEYEGRDDSKFWGVYDANGELIEDGFEDYNSAITWANEHDYDTNDQAKRGTKINISKSEMGEMAKRGMNKLTKKTWKVVYITMQGKEGSKIIELGRLSDREDVKNALKRMPDLNIREVIQIQEIAEKGTKTGKGFMVFNYTDNIYASPDVFRTKREANDFIAKFRARFEKQGYYRDNNWNKVAIKDIDLLAIPEDFSPFRKN